MARVRIKDGATVGMDMSFWAWPNLPHATLLTEFEHEGMIGDYCRLRAPHFGGEPYGNGRVSVHYRDVVWVDGQDVPFAGEGI